MPANFSSPQRTLKSINTGFSKQLFYLKYLFRIKSMTAIGRFAKTYKLLAGVLLVALMAIIVQLAGANTMVHWLLIGATLTVAIRIILEIVAELRQGNFGVDLLALVALLATLLAQEYWAGIVIAIMVATGDALEDFASARAAKELKSLIDRTPKTAQVQSANGIETKAVEAVAIGEIVIVQPGSVVPIDGCLLSEVASLDQSSLSGESLPVEVKKGESVLSGSINTSQAIQIQTTALAAESQYQQIVKLVADSSEDKAPFVRLADRIAVPFTIFALGLAGVAWWLSGEGVRFAEVLVVATPCPLLIGTPVAFISGMSRAAKNGIIIKNGTTIERLTQIKSVAFDKTGTLTTGHPSVEKVISQPGFNPDDLLGVAAALEQQSNHVLANAIVKAGQEKLTTLPIAQELHEFTGGGVSGKVNGHTVFLGSERFVAGKLTQELPAIETKPGWLLVYIALDATFAGVIVLSDQIRNESLQVIRELQHLGVNQTVMVSGDKQVNASMIGEFLGLSKSIGDCTPLAKVEHVAALPPGVLMVGDGVNDAPVLAKADVGLAMGAKGASAAGEAADVVALIDDLLAVPNVIAISKHTRKIALISVLVGLGLSVFVMFLAAFGFVPVLIGALSQEGIDILAIGIALLALRGPKEQILHRNQLSAAQNVDEKL